MMYGYRKYSVTEIRQGSISHKLKGKDDAKVLNLFKSKQAKKYNTRPEMASEMKKRSSDMRLTAELRNRQTPRGMCKTPPSTTRAGK